MSDAARPSPGFAPQSGGERLHHLDVVRGFALLGVLLMNNQFWFRAPSARYQLARFPWPGAADLWTEGILQVFFSGKSISLFALLFGLGLTLQMERAAGRIGDFAAFVRRRQGALFLIGLLHITLLWSGDILHCYAGLGLLILPFLGRSLRSLLAWAIALQAVSLVPIFLPHAPAPAASAAAEAAGWVELSRQAYLSGSWTEAMTFRWMEVTHHYARIGGWFWPGLLSLFLLGSALWRTGLLQAPEAHLPALRRLRAWGLGLGLALETAGLTRFFPGLHLPQAAAPYLTLAFRLGEPVLCVGYLAALVLLVKDPRWAARLKGLAAMGRLILTNYLLQSLVMTWIYNGYGLGLYDRLGPFASTLLCLGVYGGQIAFSLWWTARFHFGPVEWLWRGLSYGRLPAFRKDRRIEATASAT